MIIDGTGQLIASSVGWVNGGVFCVRDAKTGSTTHHHACTEGYLRLFSIDGDRFAVAAHDESNAEFILSVRRFAQPDTVLWSVRCTPTAHEFFGESSATRGLRRHHLVMFKRGRESEYSLLTMAEDGRGLSQSSLPWFNEDNYDLVWQGLMDVVALPRSEHVLVSVQRSSTLIVHDPRSESVVEQIKLLGRNGNPMLVVVDDELWTIDYDTFVRVQLESRKVVGSVLIQPAQKSTRCFAGHLHVWERQQLAVVPRPFSGDIAFIDPVSCNIKYTVPIGKQPLTCVVTDNERIIAQDWKTGEWLEGSAKSGRRRLWRIW